MVFSASDSILFSSPFSKKVCLGAALRKLIFQPLMKASFLINFTNYE